MCLLHLLLSSKQMGDKMKRLVLILFSLAILCGISAIEVSGIQSGTWDPANNPHALVGDVTVPEGSELTILPGVIVQAWGNYRINAEGSIQAIGTEADSIYFRSGMMPVAMWKGLRLENPTAQSNFMHIVVEDAEYGINAVDAPMEVSYSRFSHNQRGLHLYGIGNPNPAAMNVHHNLIEHTLQNGILIPQNSNAWVHHNEVRYNGNVPQYYGAIQLSNQSTGGQNNPIIEHNYIHSNFKQGITAWDVVGASAINPIIRYNHIEGNLTGIYLLNASGIVHNNTIINNFIPGDTNSGAGMMIGGATSLPYIAENVLTGNFTAFYITTNAMPVLGDLASDHPWAHGQNVIQNNIDESNTLHSVVCASYSNNANVIKAENNDWGAYTAAEIAIGIVDSNDSASLPTVDFEPWFEPQTGITITGSYSWDPEDYDDLEPQELQLLLIEVNSQEILESHVLQSNPFSIQSNVNTLFYALITGVDPEREIWAAPNSLEQMMPFNPADGDLPLGDIYIDAWQHYNYEIRGTVQNIEGREVWPMYQGFLVFAPDKIDYFYDEGDYRYLYKHQYYDGTDWQEINFGWGQVYTKLTNLGHGESWIQNYVEGGAPIQRFITCSIDQNGGISFVTRSAMDVILEQTFIGYALLYNHSYLYDDEGYADRYLDTVTVEPGVWLKYHRANPSRPNEFRLQAANLCNSDAYAMDLWWTAPAYDGTDYDAYRVYMQPENQAAQLFATVPFSANSYFAPSINQNGKVSFWIVATDGSIESEASDVASFDFPTSNQDLIQKPELAIYPNPVSFKNGNTLKLQGKGFTKPVLKIYNIRGQEVFSSKMDAERFTWQGLDSKGKAVGSGVYLLKIDSINQPTISRKIMVIK